MIDLVATLPHYLAHLAPIWRALPDELRGTAYSPGTIPGLAPLPHAWATDRPVLVASFMDAQRVGARPTIYVEHGSGQTYRGDPAGDHPSYSGGPGHERAALFLSPNETVAARWRERYPATPSVAVGSPRLDEWHTSPRARPAGAPLTVAVTFHWECLLVPETRSAWPHFDPVLPEFVARARARGWRVLGHGHPRLWGRIARRWAEIGVDHTAEFDVVLREADVLVVDNSSAAMEFASTGRPVVWLSAPWYRRDVDHGGRFWRWVEAGPHVTEPDVDALVEAVASAGAWAAVREEIVDEVYPVRDGSAAARAVDAIRRLLT